MDCDGTKAGYDNELTAAVADLVSIPVIASGGAGTKEHFYDALTKGKADAVGQVQNNIADAIQDSTKEVEKISDFVVLSRHIMIKCFLVLKILKKVIT